MAISNCELNLYSDKNILNKKKCFFFIFYLNKYEKMNRQCASESNHAPAPKKWINGYG